jgi:hypothetical protein
MMPDPRALLTAALVFITLVCYASAVRAQADVSWLIAVWDGKQTSAPTFPATITVVTFTEEGNGIKWELVLTNPAGFTSKARGDAVVTGSAVEMKGAYYGGLALSYTLPRDGDKLRGHGIGAYHRFFDTIMTRRK